MKRSHYYEVRVLWTGNLGSGTETYNSYLRDHNIEAGNKPVIAASSDPVFKGNSHRYNPEEMLVAALSSCHMLWYLHLCSQAGVIVTGYKDEARGIMEETAEGGGRFTEVILAPSVVVAGESMIDRANELHHEANRLCFIANSCNFPIRHNPTCLAKS